MSENKQISLIAICLKISKLYKLELKYYNERFTNNKNPKFTDIEAITIYLFALKQHKFFEIKQIYRFAIDYLLSWFPDLPSYKAFNTRLNKLSSFLCISQVFSHD